MKTYHARHETLLCRYQYWLSGLTKLAVCQGMCNPFIKNSHQLMVADIRFPDNDSTPAIVPVCLYRLIHGKTLPEPLSVQSDMDPDAGGHFTQRVYATWATFVCQQTD